MAGSGQDLGILPWHRAHPHPHPPTQIASWPVQPQAFCQFLKGHRSGTFPWPPVTYFLSILQILAKCPSPRWLFQTSGWSNYRSPSMRSHPFWTICVHTYIEVI